MSGVSVPAGLPTCAVPILSTVEFLMKSTILRSGIALACALGLAACGGGSGDLYLQGGVSGVTKDGLVLQNNGGHDTAVVTPYTSFTFADRVSTDDLFNVTVKEKPSNVESCVVNGGKAHANYYSIAQISVVCTIKVHRMVVSVTGLKNSGLVLINGADRVAVPATVSGSTTAEMAQVYEDAPYGIAVLTQPAGQTCTVGGGDNGRGGGIMLSTDLIGKVVVTCS
jgi:hypothetical protein